MKIVKADTPAATKTSVKLTDAQRDVVQGYLNVMKQAEQHANQFLQYIAKENELEGNWNLSPDGSALNLAPEKQ